MTILKRLALVAALLLVPACTDEDATRSTLGKAGYTHVQTTGYSWGECGKDDNTATGFVATNPLGQRVEGTVCCGFWLKGCTIRF